jgi:hypothetical protein
MAEFDELDGVLRDALQRAAQPGDSTGVADAIRSRIAAGDPGTSVAGSTAPGWGGGVWSWLPWVGLVVLAGIGGGALGASGVVGAEATTETVVERTAVLDGTAPAASCPGGPIADTLAAGTRVLVVERSADVAHLGIRDPHDFSAVLWLSAGDVIVDAGQPAIDSLPVGDACPVVILTAPLPVETPAPAPEEIPVPVPVPQPAPGDTTPPTVGQQYAVHLSYTSTAVVHVFANDNVGVTSVSIRWSGASSSGFVPMTRVGATNEWIYNYTRSGPDGVVTFAMKASDAAGNQSGEVTTSINQMTLG